MLEVLVDDHTIVRIVRHSNDQPPEECHFDTLSEDEQTKILNKILNEET